MTAVIIILDSHIDDLNRGVVIADGDDGDIDIGGFLNSLGVCMRIRDDDQAGIFEGVGDVVCEVFMGKAVGDGDGFKDNTSAAGACEDDGDVGGVVDCDYNAGC